MPEIHVSAEREMSASAEKVYACIRDFKECHPKFLPSAFSDMKVEEGGVGEGTVYSFAMTVGPRHRSFRMKITEPEPGKILTESDMLSSLVTTWTVTARAAGSLVRLDTRWNGKSGMGGFMERLFAPPSLRKIYVEELGLLDACTRSEASGPA